MIRKNTKKTKDKQSHVYIYMYIHIEREKNALREEEPFEKKERGQTKREDKKKTMKK